MSYFLLVLKGALFGIANLIPGVSGGTVAVITGVYEKLLDAINNLFKKFKKSILFLLLFALGAALAILAGAKGIDWCLKYFEVPTSLLFMGLIIGSMKAVTEPVKGKLKWYHYIVMAITIAFVVGLLFLPKKESSDSLATYEYFVLALCGFLASVAMVVPGISGMMMFYLFGYYDTLMGAIGGLTKLSTIGSSVLVLLPVAIGVIVGIFTAAKVISILLKKFPVGAYAAIIGFVIGSLFALVYEGGIVDEIMAMVYASSWKEYFTQSVTIGNHLAYKTLILTLGFLLFFVGLFASMLLSASGKKTAPEAEKPEIDREAMKAEILAEMNGTKNPSVEDAVLDETEEDKKDD